MRPSSLQTFVVALAVGALGCDDQGVTDVASAGTGAGSSGGVAASGGASAGGSTSAGGASAGTGSGGLTTGGSSAAGTSATGGASSGGTATGGSGGTGSPECTNVRPTGTEWDEATCEQWASDTSECDSAWMIDGDYCNESCGRCSPGGGGAGGSGSLDCSGPALTGGTQHCSSTQGTLGNGVAYSVWLSAATTGTNCGTFYNADAAFKAAWNMGSGGDFLARTGLQWNKTQTHAQLGTISADYAYTKSGVSNTTAFIGVYGWSSNPLVEFYIIEEWIGWNPASNATKTGTFSVDDGTYDVYTHTQENQPSIEGTATFPQYFSIRQSARQCGHISVSDHFDEWSSLGMGLGMMYEAKLLVEAMGGSGTVDFTTANVVVE